jgi:ketosteroid isomerase-like protein
MASESNIETVKGIYEAFGAGDVDSILAQLADDVDWSAETSSDAAPWYGDRKGKDQVPGFFQAIGEALDVSKFEPLAMTASENEVMVRIDFAFTVKATGKDASMVIYHYWRFDQEGKVDYYRGTEDTAATLAALEA